VWVWAGTAVWRGGAGQRRGGAGRGCGGVLRIGHHGALHAGMASCSVVRGFG
jgi:hypothetical protein